MERYINDKTGNEQKVNISNGWWEKLIKRNPSLCLRSEDSTARVRMNVRINMIYFREYLRGMGLLITLIITWLRQECH